MSVCANCRRINTNRATTSSSITSPSCRCSDSTSCPYASERSCVRTTAIANWHVTRIAMAQWAIRNGRAWVMMAGCRVRRLLDRNAQLHLRVDAATHLVGPRLHERDLELGSGLLKATIEVHSLARHGDVVRRAIVIDENHHLSLGDIQVFNTELQAFLCDRDRRGRTDRTGQHHCRDQAKQTCSIHRYLRKHDGFIVATGGRRRASQHWSGYP